MKPSTYGGLIMAIRLFLVLLLAAIGCEQKSAARVDGVRTVKKERSSQDESSIRSEPGRERVEELLLEDLKSIPVHGRYDGVLKNADKLWNALDGFPSEDKEYVILAAARFHQKISRLLSETNIPQKSYCLGEPRRSKDGTFYYVTSKELGLRALEESRYISEARNCQMQLRHFMSRYPNGIDSVRLQGMFESIPESDKKELMNQIKSILGRKPVWAN